MLGPIGDFIGIFEANPKKIWIYVSFATILTNIYKFYIMKIDTI